MFSPLIQLCDTTKEFSTGSFQVRALDNVSLSIEQGEFVAVMGPSGSGKSTLLNILGLLDVPSSGTYFMDGTKVSDLSEDSLAKIRCHMVGVLLQKPSLLPALNAIENTELPGLYAALPPGVRRQQAGALLAKLGLEDRRAFRPHQLSGGELQRVALARAMMNDRKILLADEPTAFLDAKSAEAILDIFETLHREGYTLIIVTHDAAVARRASRVLRIAHGKILADEHFPSSNYARPTTLVVRSGKNDTGWSQIALQAITIALRSLRAHAFRSALTLLGYVFGVAAVLLTMAVSDGGQREVLAKIASLGTNLLVVRAGGVGMRATDEWAELQPEDASAIAKIQNVEIASSERGGRYTVRRGNLDYQTTIIGTSAEYALARDWPLAAGGFFTIEDERSYAPVAVIGTTAARMLFPEGGAVGQHIVLKGTPYEVVGLLSPRGGAGTGADQDDIVLLPLSTSLMRLFGRKYVNVITVRVSDLGKSDSTQAEIVRVLEQRHKLRRFQVVSMSSFIDLRTTAQAHLSASLLVISVVSLGLAGIAMMNVMLASLTERAREIGVRQINGARPWSITFQLNVEAIALGAVGGLLGIVGGYAVMYLLALAGIPCAASVKGALLALGSACLIAVVFGHLPARRAAQLNPAHAITLS